MGRFRFQNGQFDLQSTIDRIESDFLLPDLRNGFDSCNNMLMSRNPLSIGWLALGFLAVSSQLLHAQTITGVSNKAQYIDEVNFTVVEAAGFDTTATLNGAVVPVGTPYRVDRMDFYELTALQTPSGGGATTSNTLHFIVLSANRGTPEKGLIEWTPYPLTPSTTAEFSGGQLDLIVPRDYPQDLEIPVVAWVRDFQGNEIRGNGTITADGFADSPVRILRGVGSGFLPATTNGSPLSYGAQFAGMTNSKTVNIDTNTVWTTFSGSLSGANIWPANSRIHITADVSIPAGSSLTIEEGSIIKLNPLVTLTVNGAFAINGTLVRPVVMTSAHPVLPEVRTHAWGGFVLQGSAASLYASSAIMVGGGGAPSWSFSPGKSHRSEQAVLFVHEGASVILTDCAILNTAGQVGNGYNSNLTFERTLLQRAITAGEYVGGIITFDHSALIEFPADNGEVSAAIAEADYDAIYFTTGTHILLNSLIGFCKDDAIDSGSGGSGSVVVSNCWMEASLHEAMAWSGAGRVTETFDTVSMNNGQGFECGWSSGISSPLCYGENLLLTGNAVGARFGDNYDWNYNGEMTLTNSLILNNYRDIWGYAWDNWTYHAAQMDLQGNWVTQENDNHPNNALWDPSSDAARLLPFMRTAPSADVGIGIATWESQTAMNRLVDGVPVRLSTFTTNTVSVSYRIQDVTTAVLDSGILTFQPGETLKYIPTATIEPVGHELLRVSLEQPSHAELTGTKRFYFVEGFGTPVSGTTLLLRNSVWKYHDLGQDLGTAWKESSFDDSSWSAGLGELGNGDGDEDTQINIGPSGARFPTVYFRKTISIPDPSLYGSLEFGLHRDDGAVIYINGTEVYRDSNVPSNATYSTYATGLTPSETPYRQVISDASLLHPGDNVIAVEVKQESATSLGLSFDLELFGLPGPSFEVNMINFRPELLLYWIDPALSLEETDDLNSGQWNPVPSASPVEVSMDRLHLFFRLWEP
jgi:hypothetical protein